MSFWWEDSTSEWRVRHQKYGRFGNPCSEIYLESPQQPVEDKGKTMADKTLYEIKQDDNVVFGHKLAVNSKGEWVMEIKGTGVVVALDKALVTKVVPFTVSIKFTEHGTEYHYLANAEDGWEVDQFLIMPPYGGSGGYQIARVTSVDTKSDRATAEISYLKRIK
jgi:hypothetical protein